LANDFPRQFACVAFSGEDEANAGPVTHFGPRKGGDGTGRVRSELQDLNGDQASEVEEWLENLSPGD
jgi:hypothetical protein